MTQAELDRLVAQIGEEILARVRCRGLRPVPGKAAEGLNLPDQVCPGCVQRCAQTCARNTKEIIAAGAVARFRQREADEDRSRHRRADRSHHPEARSHPRRRHQGLPRSPPVQLRQRVRQSVLGAAGASGTGRFGGQGLHRGRLSAGRHQHRSQSGGNGHRGARRRAGNRHGDQCGRAAFGRPRRREGRYRRRWSAKPRTRPAPS